MIEKIMKAVKSGNKKRGRNITIGAVVGMLLSCTVVMGEDISGLDIANDGTEIKFNKDGIEFIPGNENDPNKDPYLENTWDEESKTYTNNTTISVTNADGIGSGINVNATGVNIVNKGTISGTAGGSSIPGYGINILSSSTVKDITNTGLIIGVGSTFYGSSHGILNKGTITGTITNNGLITGTKAGQIGYGILNSTGSIERLVNNGLITGDGSNAGATVISNVNSGNIEELINTGLITTKKGTGIQNSSYSGITTLTNSGAIHGTFNGITNASQEDITNLVNSGVISGETNAINNNETYSSIKNMLNTGTIYGKTNAMKNTGTINETNNYGLLVSGDSAGGVVNSNLSIVAHDDSTGGNNKIKNYGLAFTDDGSGGYKNYDTVNTKGNFGNIYGDVTIGEIKYTIRNAQATIANDSSGAAITNIKSFKIKDGELYEGINYDSADASTSGSVISDASTSNVILNGIENTLKVVGDNSGNSLSNATINAYGTAVEFDNTSGGSLSLTNATVNGGLKEVTPPGGTTKEKVAVILGSSGADILKLENSVINGNIDMKAGKNTIDAGNNTTINGDIKGGDDVDTFISGNNVVINGEINLGNGANKIELGNKVYINGDISTGTSKGVDFTGGSEIYLNGEVAFTDNKDIFTLGEKSVINKDIDMGAENDTLTIGAGSIVNGTLTGGDGDDTLTFGTNSGVNPASITEDNIEDSINISHDITGFENINVGTNVTFASNLTIADAAEIKIGANGVLVLKVDKNTTVSGAITGHALHGLGATSSVSSTGGRLLLDLDGAEAEQIITFGDTNLEDSIVPGDNETLDITSKVHTIKAGANINEMVVVLRWTIPEILKYKGLNGVYHGIGSVNDLIGNFNIKSDEQLVTFIEYLNNIYAGSPYSYSSELSRKSMGMFRDIVTDNQFKANAGKWMIYGGLTHVDGGTKDTYYGKGYYTYDIGSSDMDADTKITGAYMLGEYGVSDTLTSGVVIGGNKLKSDLSNGSKVDGSAMYLGAYAKKYVGNLKVTAGAGFQYGNYDADRIAVNKVVSSTGEPVMKYSDNYNDITYDIYLNGRYSHQVGDNLFLEPYATLSYTYIDQDGANEGNKTLAIETDSKSFDYTVGKVGVDLKKVIPHEKGKSTLSAGVSYTKILDGADEEHITGRFKGGSDFDILVTHKNEHSIGLNAKYALELENGVIFDVKGSYSVERDSHNGSGKNRTKGEWIVGAGIGYKF